MSWIKYFLFSSLFVLLEAHQGALQTETICLTYSGEPRFQKTSVGRLAELVTKETPLRVSIVAESPVWISFFKCGELVPLTTSRDAPKTFALSLKTAQALQSLGDIRCSASPDKDSVDLLVGSNSTGEVVIEFAVIEEEQSDAHVVWSHDWDQNSERYKPVTKYTNFHFPLINTSVVSAEFDDFLGFNMTLLIDNTLNLSGEVNLVAGEYENSTILVATAVVSKTELEAMRQTTYMYPWVVLVGQALVKTIELESGIFYWVIAFTTIGYIMVCYRVDCDIYIVPNPNPCFTDIFRTGFDASIRGYTEYFDPDLDLDSLTEEEIDNLVNEELALHQ